MTPLDELRASLPADFVALAPSRPGAVPRDRLSPARLHPVGAGRPRRHGACGRGPLPLPRPPRRRVRGEDPAAAEDPRAAREAHPPRGDGAAPAARRSATASSSPIARRTASPSSAKPRRPMSASVCRRREIAAAGYFEPRAVAKLVAKMRRAAAHRLPRQRGLRRHPVDASSCIASIRRRRTRRAQRTHLYGSLKSTEVTDMATEKSNSRSDSSSRTISSFATTATRWRDDESLLEAGLINSTGILELVAFIETDFGIPVADAEIVPENLNSIATIAAYVAGKRSTPPSRKPPDRPTAAKRTVMQGRNDAGRALSARQRAGGCRTRRLSSRASGG